jgi:hypothetical protein
MSHAACRHSLSPTAAACLPWTPRIRSAHRVGCFVAMVVARFIRGPREPTVARAVRSMDTSAYSRRRAVRSVASDPTWTLKRLRAKRGGGGHAADKSVAPGGNDRHTPLSFLSPTNQTLEAPPHTPVTLRCPCREKSRLLPSMSESASPTNTTPKPKR